jgi:hypothetical protein
MFQDARATINGGDVSRQQLLDYLASRLGVERKVRWNGRPITIPRALVRATSLGERDLISLSPEEIVVYRV